MSAARALLVATSIAAGLAAGVILIPRSLATLHQLQAQLHRSQSSASGARRSRTQRSQQNRRRRRAIVTRNRRVGAVAPVEVTHRSGALLTVLLAIAAIVALTLGLVGLLAIRRLSQRRQRQYALYEL